LQTREKRSERSAQSCQAMAAALIDSAMTSLPATSEQNRPALRRATYVHVSDLTSAYNIDHARLEQELTRVNAEREAAETSKAQGIASAEVDPTSAADFDSALVSAPQKRLQPPRGGYNLCVLVGKVNVVVDKRRVDRSRVRLAEVEIGDETGTVSLRARDEQIDVLEEVSRRSGAVVLRNCTLELYQGKHVRLAVTKWGKLSVYPDNVASTPPPPSKMNFDRNFSLIDLSVVASETVEQQQESGYGNRPGKSVESQETRSTTSKSSGQSHPKHQQQQSSTRRNTRDKRQTRGKSNTNNMAASPHYAVNQTDAAAMQPQPGQMRYHSMQPYPSYDQGMDMSQYPYAHNRQQDVMASSSAQHLLLQQYDMRQMQMYHSQPDRHRAGMGRGHHAQAPAMMLQHVVPSGSFDTTGGHQPSQQIYFPFPPASTSAYARAPTHHPNLYAQGMMYVPAAETGTTNVPGDASTSMTVSSGDDGSSKGQKTTPEKENMKST